MKITIFIGELHEYLRVTWILESYVDIEELRGYHGELREYWRVMLILESYVDIGELRGYQGELRRYHGELRGY